MDPVKIAGVAEWRHGQQEEVHPSWLHQFLPPLHPRFSDLAARCSILTRKDSAWRWGEAEESAFEAIRTRVISAPILVFPDETRPSESKPTARFATGAVLSQQSPEDDKWHPVAYYSKSLSVVERNTRSMTRKCWQSSDSGRLAPFPGGAHHRVEIWTDHKNLEYFMTAKNSTAAGSVVPLPVRIQLAMHHRPGRSMGSRRSIPQSGPWYRAGDNSNVTLLRPEFFAAHAVRASPDYRWKERARYPSGRSARETARAGRRTQFAKSATELRRSRESLSEHRSGRSRWTPLFPGPNLVT